MYETTTSESATSVARLAAAQREAQAAFARTVTASVSYVDGAAIDDAAEVCAVAEVSAALAVSNRTVTEWVFLVRTARPAVLEAFCDGRLAYSAFRTVCRSLAGVPSATAELVRRVIAVAQRCTPGAVATAIDRILAEFDADWHRTARERATAERRVSVRKLPRAQADLTIRGPAERIAGMQRAIVDGARGLCAADPRPIAARMFDAAHALLTGTPFGCECPADECPRRAGTTTAPTNQAVIHLDAATAAGLADEPGHLEGWGPVPADVARRIAEDATWQALIAESRSFPDREARRTRRMPAGWMPLGTRRTLESAEYLRGLPPPTLARATADRAVANSDGHGGFALPPAGALTYRPSEAVAMRVRALYTVCVHPGCSVPSVGCDLDHVVPFDHANPVAGGWSVIGNLQPLCRTHHGLKTRRQWNYRLLSDGIVHIRDSRGNNYLTAPGE